jgi:hypothetical protein
MKENKTMNKSVCFTCNHYDGAKCGLTSGKLYNINLYGSELETAEHDCPEYEETIYDLTPKGVLYVTLLDQGIEIPVDKFDDLWESFERSLVKRGLLKIEE